MATSLIQFAKKVGLSKEQLIARSAALGFDIDEKATELEDDLAALLSEEFKKEVSDKADTYGEIVSQEMEKELIKKQRKKTAGRHGVKAKDDSAKEEVIVKKGIIEIPDFISVKEFSEKVGISPVRVIGELMKNGILANINQPIDFEIASILAEDLGVKIRRKHSAAESEDIMRGDLEKLLQEDDASILKERPPVVTVMGHVDHGKTKLLDTIRDANVVASESGGITQHIGAYQVEKNGHKITFLDTPGHEAFTAMRARGARATDVAILVVASDEGVKPQTVEAINHAKEAKVPIIVAINKMDKPNANPDKVKGELAEHELIPEEWGGETVMVPISALKNEGIDKLLDMILVVSELLDLKANPNRPAVGTVIEAHLDPSLGPVATILINTGTLKVMDPVIVGATHGRIKIMQNHTGKRFKDLGPSGTALIAGLSKTPQAGDILQVINNERSARQKAEEVSALIKEGKIQNMGMGLGEIVEQIKEGQLKTVKVVLKADTNGSLEAIKQSIAKELKSSDVAVKVIHSGVGNVTESDVMMAAASQGVVIGFHTDVPSQAERMAERHNTEVSVYKVIYELIDDLRKILSGLLEPETIVVELGKAKVLQVFFTGNNEMVVGCKINDGKAEVNSSIKVFRDKEQIGIGKAVGLKLVNEDVKEIKKGTECGIRYKGKIKLQEGDVLEFSKEETRHKTL
ncbi:translation initiation factor IF-2 [Candidatus Peregrinibacteria bacterium]|jgi:translation initiation factor IF-2|nr:translation initiation factor IF-2 [Candidatus Peregrinibacteria bacterium]MBT7703843.1 translation initiation factor IF-2 [Candidatus Peregrinibacteria bacterium]